MCFTDYSVFIVDSYASEERTANLTAPDVDLHIGITVYQCMSFRYQYIQRSTYDSYINLAVLISYDNATEHLAYVNLINATSKTFLYNIPIDSENMYDAADFTFIATKSGVATSYSNNYLFIFEVEFLQTPCKSEYKVNLFSLIGTIVTIVCQF